MAGTSFVDRAVSPSVGLVHSTSALFPPPGHPRLANFAVRSADIELLTGAAVDARAGASHFCSESARAAAVAEALERYSACVIPPGHVFWACARETPDAVDIDRLQVYTDTQKEAGPYRDLRDTDRIGWVRGSDLITGDDVAVPAGMVYLGYQPAEHEPDVGPFTSSGLACAASPIEAQVKAILEVVERDAFMLTWRLRLRHRPIDWARHPQLVRVARAMRGTRVTLRMLDATWINDVPTVIATMSDEASAYPFALAVGVSSGRTYTEAGEGAFREACQTAMLCDQLQRFPGKFADLSDSPFDSHVRHHIDPQHRHESRFLFAEQTFATIAPDREIAGDDAAEQLAELVERGTSIGGPIVVLDVTSDDVASLGLHVWRAVLGEACWLDVDEVQPYLGRPRFSEFSRQHDLPQVPVNDALHPFP